MCQLVRVTLHVFFNVTNNYCYFYPSFNLNGGPFGLVNNMKIVDFPKVAMCFSRKKKSIFSIEDIVAKINWKEMHKD